MFDEYDLFLKDRLMCDNCRFFVPVVQEIEGPKGLLHLCAVCYEKYSISLELAENYDRTNRLAEIALESGTVKGRIKNGYALLKAMIGLAVATLRLKRLSNLISKSEKKIEKDFEKYGSPTKEDLEFAMKLFKKYET